MNNIANSSHHSYPLCFANKLQDPELGTVSTTCFTFSVLFWTFGLEVFGLSICESGRDVGATPAKFSPCVDIPVASLLSAPPWAAAYGTFECRQAVTSSP